MVSNQFEIVRLKFKRTEVKNMCINNEINHVQFLGQKFFDKGYFMEFIIRITFNQNFKYIKQSKTKKIY